VRSLCLLVLVGAGGCCWPVGEEGPATAVPIERPAPAVVAPPPEPVSAPEPEAVAVKPRAVNPAPRPKVVKPTVTKPEPVALGTVVVGGDARKVLLLGDGHEAKVEDGGEAPVGNYTVKVWFQGDPVPQSSLRIGVTEGQTVTITCSSAGKWCRRGEHALEPMDTGAE